MDKRLLKFRDEKGNARILPLFLLNVVFFFIPALIRIFLIDPILYNDWIFSWAAFYKDLIVVFAVVIGVTFFGYLVNHEKIQKSMKTVRGFIIGNLVVDVVCMPLIIYIFIAFVMKLIDGYRFQWLLFCFCFGTALFAASLIIYRVGKKRII